ncbi:putative beige beach domain-containing protein [Erysiphe necator]|uniref:Putative beige beach domain-containing protein n=1 Tax=Uncinula necator TaxID=52586 RepID=A0A0B1PHF6_UNCNE|nr:putative beige beach domain-containing protein [Erysiphe necator]
MRGRKMSSPDRRPISPDSFCSPSDDADPLVDLRLLLANFAAVLQPQNQGSYPNIKTLIEISKSIQHYISASSCIVRVNDNFRHLQGFQILLDTLRSFVGYYHPIIRNVEENNLMFELLEAIFEILALNFRDNVRNQRFFRRRIEYGGWSTLRQNIADIGICGGEQDSWGELKLIGVMISFALGDKRLIALCQEVFELHQSMTSEVSLVSERLDEIKGPKISHNYSLTEYIDKRLSEIIQDGTLLHFPDIIPILIDFWKLISRNNENPNPAALIAIKTLTRISLLSSHNLWALQSTGILSSLLPLVFSSDSLLGPHERQSVEILCESLISLGVNNLSDTEYLIRSKLPGATDFLLRALKSSCVPPCVHFDLSLYGYASIELPSLGRQFPPINMPGYTFTAWINVDQFDHKVHTTLFGAFDSTQNCFVLLYLERDTHNFILQTSVNSSKPSVRFKSTVFTEKRWYHIAVVHKKPRAISSSKALLYVDGEFVEQVKCQYPASLPLSNTSTESFTSFTSSSYKNNSIQVFLGTPKDLSSFVGSNLIFTRWSLSSAHLIEDILSSDLIAVYYRLGPLYNGNFQDSLGSFQTYEASAALGMRNETLYPGRDDRSDILSAIRGKAGNLLPEIRILFSIIPTAIYGDDRRSIYESQLPRTLDKNLSHHLTQLTFNKCSLVAINAAFPRIKNALTCTYGTATLNGGPFVIVPRLLDDTLWQLGGFTPIALKLVENSVTSSEIIKAVEILFWGIKGNWRNSEAMERENGYAILAALIRGKIGAGTVISSKCSAENLNVKKEERNELSFRLLNLILMFVGYNSKNPEESYIVNPLAYRIFLVDFDMWRKTPLITQMLYYKQFIMFGVKSKFYEFNLRRLFRMRVVKRFLDALKAEAFYEDIFPSFLEAFTSLVKCNLCVEVFRSLALFITYSLYKPQASNPRNAKNALNIPSTPQTSSKRPRIVTISSCESRKNYVTKRQCGIKVLEIYSNILCERGNTSNIRKFSKTVTNKWLLHLLADDEAQVILHGTKILVRLIVVQGSSYMTKFANKTGGFVIMRHKLKRWWNLPALWRLCFCVLFNKDVAEIDLERSFELFSLLEIFSDCRITNPQVLPVITSMLQHGVKEILRNQEDPDSPMTTYEKEKYHDTPFLEIPKYAPTTRRRSISLTNDIEFQQLNKPRKEYLSGQAAILQTVVRFFADLHGKAFEFRDFALSSDYVKLLLAVLFPAIVSTDIVSAETELNSRDSALTFEGNDVIIRPITRVMRPPTPKIKTPVETQSTTSNTASRTKAHRHGFSFVLLTSRPSEFSPSSAKLTLVTSPGKKSITQQVSNALIEDLLELIICVFIDRVMFRKEFPGFGLFSKTPPGFKEHQVYFTTYILRNTISHLSNTIQLDQKSLWEPKVIQNMARFVAHICEAVFEGWFLSGAEPLIDFAGTLLEYLQRPEISKIKNVRLCHQAVVIIKGVFFRVVLLRLSELDSRHVSEHEAVVFMDKLFYWQAVLLSSDTSQDDFLKLVCYQIYLKLVDPRERVQFAAANLWRIMLVQKPAETLSLFENITSPEHRKLINGFRKLVELDNEVFIRWVDERRTELDLLFSGAMSKTWEKFVSSENEKTEETNKARVSRRKEKLKLWHSEELNEEEIIRSYNIAAASWMKNIYMSEHLKYQRGQQDQQDNFIFLASIFSNMDYELHRPCAIFHQESHIRWKLDRTEGRNRMRIRMLPDRTSLAYNYLPKRRTTESSINSSNSDIRSRAQTSNMPPSSTLSLGEYDLGSNNESAENNTGERSENSAQEIENIIPEDDFEIVDDPNDPGEDDNYEDKNRKVMRSLQRGDQVQYVFNVSRIIGLEACEGLCIIGKDCLYLIDNMFQRSDGEIVDVMQAPKEERDPYLQMISGKRDLRHSSDDKSLHVRADQLARSWKWNDLISISKRRFLFRNVALEVFFTDGRSYLLTAISPSSRDDLHSKIIIKAPHTNGNTCLPNPEDGWRLETLKVSEEPPTSLSHKFGNIFNSSPWNPATKKWIKGEISNYHYLMLVNTMAGRTFNDLTQYPVFPWVLSDYTSSELDLNNPASFRDLSKPMGAQHNSRASEFIERYKQFADMGDQNTPAFHYGTHYSSAMIVTSYLIRLQPFVKSYLLLQGGNFDHPDRLFYSIKEAWLSASRDNMTDVRELIPEFFYLPEFLTNSNSFNFGVRQGKGGAIDTVELPPWARGDPKIFIAKHREALESPYVSRNLHQWIDLIFGCKQRGDAAVDSVNVFHYLSYHGAKDLESISDPMQKLATIGIIHNFGQTPHQIFTKPHQSQEDIRSKPKRLDTSIHSLKRLPFPLFEFYNRISSIDYLPKTDRLLCSTACRLNLPPYYDKYLEFGFADGSIRFFYTDSNKPAGLFENLHQGQITTAIFASSTLLVTAGEESVVSIHNIITSQGKTVDLQPRTSLFGHRAPVTTLAVSKSFSTLLTASVNGVVILWDLNTFRFVRKLSSENESISCASINDVNGNIMICRGQKVTLYTLNGEIFLEQVICDDHDDKIASCAWYEGIANEWIENELCFTGQRGGVVNCWKKTVSEGTSNWNLELVKKLQHYSAKTDQVCESSVIGSLVIPRIGRSRSNISISDSEGSITCIKPMAQSIYTGDEDGRVYEWSFS